MPGVEALLVVVVCLGWKVESRGQIGQLYVRGSLPGVFVAVLQILQMVVRFQAGGFDGLTQFAGLSALPFGLQVEVVGQVMACGIVFVSQVGVQGIGCQAVVGLFVEAYGICRGVEGLGVAALLVDVVACIAGLQAQGAFVGVPVHAVGVGRIGFVEQQAACVERCADGRLAEQFGQLYFRLPARGQQGLLVAQVVTGVVGLQGKDALPSPSQLQGTQGTFPEWGRMSVILFRQSAAHFERGEPLVACLLVQAQVEGHFLRVELAAQGTYRLVVLHQFGRLYGTGVEVVVHLVVAAARHVHAFYEEMVDGLPLVGHRSVLFDVDAGQAFQHIFYVDVFLAKEVGQVVAHGVAPCRDASGAYLHLAEHDAFGVQGKVSLSAFGDVAYLPGIPQQRGAYL